MLEAAAELLLEEELVVGLALNQEGAAEEEVIQQSRESPISSFKQVEVAVVEEVKM